MFQALGGIASAFGLAGSAGLNAYIPLLLVALASRFPTNAPLIDLQEPYNLLSNGWVIGLIVVLLLIETFVDKIPAVDTINDVIHTFIRPAAGAILFAANAHVITNVHPAVALVAGLIIAGGVHTAKGTVRPLVTASTAGTGNWLVSILEDVVSFFVSVFAILMPLLVGIVLFFLLAFVAIIYRRRQQKARSKNSIPAL